jgi:hypothetical protein
VFLHFKKHGFLHNVNFQKQVPVRVFAQGFFSKAGFFAQVKSKLQRSAPPSCVFFVITRYLPTAGRKMDNAKQERRCICHHHPQFETAADSCLLRYAR